VAKAQAKIDADEHGTTLKRQDSLDRDARPEAEVVEGVVEGVAEEDRRDSRSVTPKGIEPMEEEGQ
jgi:hypothetical protein